MLVVDRLEGPGAVLIADDDREFEVTRRRLPKDGRREGAVLRVELDQTGKPIEESPMPKSLKMAKLDAIKSAASPHALWAKVSNDEFFPIQVYYGAFYEEQLDPYDKSAEGGARLRRLGEQLEHTINWLNKEVWWDKLGKSHDSKNLQPVSTVAPVAKRLEDLKGQNEAMRRLLLTLLRMIDAAVYTERSTVDKLFSLG